MSTLDDIKNALPDYAKDLKLNLGAVTREIPGVSKQQQWGCLLACAIASRNPELRGAIAAEAANHLDETATGAAKAAAAVMAMNNVYYRAAHLLSDEEYLKMPANLRMQIIGKPGIDKADFELICLAVSAVNGCGMCLDSHDKVLKQAGVSREVIQHALRIASVVHAVAVTVEDEKASADAVAAAA